MHFPHPLCKAFHDLHPAAALLIGAKVLVGAYPHYSEKTGDRYCESRGHQQASRPTLEQAQLCLANGQYETLLHR